MPGVDAFHRVQGRFETENTSRAVNVDSLVQSPQNPSGYDMHGKQ
jgi:hypothetical protein